MSNVTNPTVTDITNLTPTIQDYLSLIYVLERDSEPVVGSHLAALIGVTPPTITNTLKRMVRDGLITMNADGTHLTDLGWDAARVVMRRHMLMEWMMVDTLPWAKLHSEAHNLEHAISSMTETALLEKLNHPVTCPHGNPLPGNEEKVGKWKKLTALPAGQKGVIRRIHELAEENADLLAFFEQKKITPGNPVLVTEILPFNQTISIEVDQQIVTLGYTAAQYVFLDV